MLTIMNYFHSIHIYILYITIISPRVAIKIRSDGNSFYKLNESEMG